MSASAYVAGVLGAVVVVAALAFGAWWVRAAVLPGWSGAPARLAESIVAIATLIAVAQLLGTFGALRGVPTLLVATAAGLLLGLVGGARVRARPRASDDTRATAGVAVASPRLEIWAAIVATAFVAAQWAMHVAVAYGRGITQGDSLWYHASYAADFVESGRITGFYDNSLVGLTQPQFIPLNGSLVQAVATLPFHRDFLSPLVNVGWAALAVLAAVCAGRRHGTAALLVLATVVLLGAPTISGTQPGQAPNDIASVALLVAAIALLFEGGVQPAPAALAGIAAGLAFGTKPTVAFPLLVLTIGVVVVAVRGRRLSAAVWWCAGLVGFGSYWFVRNAAVYGNPFPWTTVHLGPFTLSRTFHLSAGLWDLLGHSSAWDAWIFPGFSTSLGRGWWALLALAVGGALWAVVRGPGPLRRFTGVAVVAGIVGVAFVPTGSAFAGAVFVFMVRYLAPSLLIGLWLLAGALTDAPSWARRALALVLVVILAVAATTTYPESMPAWPRWEPTTGVIAGVLVFGALAWFFLASPTARRPIVLIGGAVVALLCIGLGWPLRDHYFDHRYVRAGLPHDDLNAWFERVRDANVAVFGTAHFYPFFGADLSNDVSHRIPAGGTQSGDCREWLTLLQRGRYDYIVVAHDPFSFAIPDEAWFRHAVTVEHQSDDATVYRVVGRIDPADCPQA